MRGSRPTAYLGRQTQSRDSHKGARPKISARFNHLIVSRRRKLTCCHGRLIGGLARKLVQFLAPTIEL